MLKNNISNQVDVETYRMAAEFQRIGNHGVHQAQEEARRAGVPNVYSINGILHWELPDGSLTTVDPWINPVADAGKD